MKKQFHNNIKQIYVKEHMSEIILPGYTRVTEPLDGFSKYDMIPEEVLEKAADRGRRIHKYCEMYSQGLFYNVDDDCRNQMMCFEKWFDENVVKVIFCEKRIYHPIYMLTGCVDMLAILKGDIQPSVIDIKSTCNTYKSWSLQTAAYQMLLQDILEIKPISRIAINLPKTGNSIKVLEYGNYDEDIRLYLNCLELYRFLNPEKKKKNKKSNENISTENDFLLAF